MLVCLWGAAAEKVFPSKFDRNWRCPNFVEKIPEGYSRSLDNLNDVFVNSSLATLVPGTWLWNNSAVILVKRTKDGTPFFKYYGNGHENFAIETWSSSKVFSAMNGAGRLNEECRGTCAHPGLSQSTTGDYGKTFLGDLVTIIVTYDYTHPPYTSNGLGGWFEMVGTRDRAVRLIQDWMQRPNETLGANYGLEPPLDLQFTFQPGNCTIVPDSPHNGDHSNTLSALTAAELLKRAACVRELPEAQHFPNTTWWDSRTLLYGAVNSTLFPGRIWGGMSAISDDLLREGLNMTLIEQRSNGTWRTFGKDGGGYSYIRLAGEAIYNGYACYPSLENPEESVEYFVSTRVSIPGDTHAVRAYTNIRVAMEALNKAIFELRLK
jgi:hypothetical protein